MVQIGAKVNRSQAARKSDANVALLLNQIIECIRMPNGMESVIRQRWNGAVTEGLTGFTAVPDVLIRSQSHLKLSAIEMGVVLNLLLHWWQSDGEWPYPRLSTIAHRMGVTRRTVERAIRSLEDKGLIERLEGEYSSDGLTVRRFDLSGLVATLKGLADGLRNKAERQDSAA